MSTSELSDTRRDYSKNTLRRTDLATDPIEQFSGWLNAANDRKLLDATAMTLSTVDANGHPHSRVVLLKHFDTKGFVWYTNQKSDKAGQLDANHHACLLFYWRELERQVRIAGIVDRLDAGDADDYFYSRPRGSRFSAAASNQSASIANREILEERVKQLREQYKDGNVPRPESWGGYRLHATGFEFWQGRSDRLHDRFVYKSGSDTHEWQINRLSP